MRLSEKPTLFSLSVWPSKPTQYKKQQLSPLSSRIIKNANVQIHQILPISYNQFVLEKQLSSNREQINYQLYQQEVKRRNKQVQILKNIWLASKKNNNLQRIKSAKSLKNSRKLYIAHSDNQDRQKSLTQRINSQRQLYFGSSAKRKQKHSPITYNKKQQIKKSQYDQYYMKDKPKMQMSIHQNFNINKNSYEQQSTKSRPNNKNNKANMSTSYRQVVQCAQNERASKQRISQKSKTGKLYTMHQSPTMMGINKSNNKGHKKSLNKNKLSFHSPIHNPVHQNTTNQNSPSHHNNGPNKMNMRTSIGKSGMPQITKLLSCMSKLMERWQQLDSKHREQLMEMNMSVNMGKTFIDNMGSSLNLANDNDVVTNVITYTCRGNGQTPIPILINQINEDIYEDQIENQCHNVAPKSSDTSGDKFKRSHNNIDVRGTQRLGSLYQLSDIEKRRLYKIQKIQKQKLRVQIDSIRMQIKNCQKMGQCYV